MQGNLSTGELCERYFGNLWFFVWVFAGKIPSFLKLGKELLIVHGVSSGFSGRAVCAMMIGIVFLCVA